MIELEQSPSIYALVLNWNGADEAIECLNSLKRQTYTQITLLVVDNGSEDDSISCITAAHPDVEIIANAENLGFAGGVNVGLRYAYEAGAEHVLILNNDLILDEHCVEEMAAHTAADVGFVTGVVYHLDDPQRIWTLSGEISRVTLERVVDGREQIDEGQFPRVAERHFAPGGASLMSRRVYEVTDGFDEGFFLYYEDSDLSLRTHKAGLKVLACSRAKMWHAISRSSGGSDSPRERYWMARSSVRYFAKHMQWWQAPIILFWRAGSAVRTTWRLWRKGRREALAAYWRGLWHGLKELPDLERG